jgi:hypothetical protein
MPLFEVVILEVPTAKELKEGEVEKLAFGPKFIVARDGQSAAIRAIMDNTAEAALVDQNKMQVLVRPFS